MNKIAQDLDRRTLASDPEMAIKAKRGTALSVRDIAAIDSILTGPDGINFDRKSFSGACIGQALCLARRGCGLLFDLGAEYYQQKPSADDARAALLYVQQTTKVLSDESLDTGSIAKIAASILAAGHSETALEIIKCIGGEKYLTWEAPQVATLQGGTLPPVPVK